MNNEYKYIIKKCFPTMRDDDLEAVFDVAKIAEKRFDMCADFRSAVEEHLKDKGYSKKKLKDFMELYDAVFAIGNSTGATMYSLVNDTGKKTNHLFEF